MKKQFIIALSLACSFSFAQKKELKEAEKAIKGSKFAEAKAAINQAKSLMSAMDDKAKDKFYFLEGKAFYAGGAGNLNDLDQALESFGNVKSAYSAEITQLKQDIANSLLQKGNGFYEKNDYSSASKYFEKAYNVTEKDTTLLYYAAATSVNVKEYDRALVLYEKLKQLGYTGITTQYFAINKETGEKEPFPNKELRDVSVKAKTHTTATEEVTKSKKPEIVKNVALIYISQGDNEKALEAMKDARAESPDDIDLMLSEANVHFKMGNKEEFKNILEKATKMDPDNAELQYNLGVVSAESGEKEQAKAYYEKAVDLDPNYVNAYINLSSLILERDAIITEEMGNLGLSAADERRYEVLKKEKRDVYAAAQPYLLKVLEIDSKNIDAARTLMSIYSILEENDKYKELKAKVDALEAGN